MSTRTVLPGGGEFRSWLSAPGDTRVFASIDTLTDPSFELAERTLAGCLGQAGRKILVTRQEMDSLLRMSDGTDAAAGRAATAIKILRRMQEGHLAAVCEESGSFREIFERCRTQGPVLLITGREGLAREIWNLNTEASQARVSETSAWKITEYGSVEVNDGGIGWVAAKFGTLEDTAGPVECRAARRKPDAPPPAAAIRPGSPLSKAAAFALSILAILIIALAAGAAGLLYFLTAGQDGGGKETGAVQAAAQEAAMAEPGTRETEHSPDAPPGTSLAGHSQVSGPARGRPDGERDHAARLAMAAGAATPPASPDPQGDAAEPPGRNAATGSPDGSVAAGQKPAARRDRRAAKAQAAAAPGRKAERELPKEDQEALMGYSSACWNLKLKNGCYSLGRFRIEKLGDLPGAVKAYDRACRLGHGPGCYAAGTMYRDIYHNRGNALDAFDTGCNRLHHEESCAGAAELRKK